MRGVRGGGGRGGEAGDVVEGEIRIFNNCYQVSISFLGLKKSFNLSSSIGWSGQFRNLFDKQLSKPFTIPTPPRSRRRLYLAEGLCFKLSSPLRCMFFPGGGTPLYGLGSYVPPHRVG